MIPKTRMTFRKTAPSSGDFDPERDEQEVDEQDRRPPQQAGIEAGQEDVAGMLQDAQFGDEGVHLFLIRRATTTSGNSQFKEEPENPVDPLLVKPHEQQGSRGRKGRKES